MSEIGWLAEWAEALVEKHGEDGKRMLASVALRKFLEGYAETAGVGCEFLKNPWGCNTHVLLFRGTREIRLSLDDKLVAYEPKDAARAVVEAIDSLAVEVRA